MKKKSNVYGSEIKKGGRLKETPIPYKGDIASGYLPYKNFKIQNFRCFSDFEIGSLDLINLIAGMNNVGKSSLLEALFLHIGSLNPGLALRINMWRGLGTPHEWVGMLWRTLFWKFQDKTPIKLTGQDWKGRTRSLKITSEVSSSTILEDIKAPLSAEFIKDIKQDLYLEYRDENNKIHKVKGIPEIIKKGELIEFQIRVEPLLEKQSFPGIYINSWRLGIKEEEIKRFSELRIKNLDQMVLKALQKMEPRLERLEILSPVGTSMIYGYLKDYTEPVPLPLLGDGIRRVASLVLAIGAARGGVVLVDEIENGIHHSAMKSIWEVVVEAATFFNTQIFATTHSQECIQSAHEVFKAQKKYYFRLHRLDRAGEQIKSISYDQESLEGALSIPLEVRG
jgi:AAA15 family ATPase/GTPase